MAEIPPTAVDKPKLPRSRLSSSPLRIARSLKGASDYIAHDILIYLTEAGRKLRQRAVNIPRCILDASGLDGRQAKRLLEEISALRKALESHHSISKDPKHRSNVDRVR